MGNYLVPRRKVLYLSLRFRRCAQFESLTRWTGEELGWNGEERLKESVSEALLLGRIGLDWIGLDYDWDWDCFPAWAWISSQLCSDSRARSKLRIRSEDVKGHACLILFIDSYCCSEIASRDKLSIVYVPYGIFPTAGVCTVHSTKRGQGTPCQVQLQLQVPGPDPGPGSEGVKA